LQTNARSGFREGLEVNEDGPLVGFAGLGSMGGRIVERLMAAGHEVIGWNRSEAKAEALAGRGMGRAATPRELAERCQVILSMVTDTTAVEQIADGPDGIVAGLRPRSVWADMSTISPQASRRIASRVAEAGASMLDAPVSGSLSTLEAGELAIMVGGDQDAFARIEPVLLAIGPKVKRVGDNGQALVVKVSINLALVVQVLGFCEGVALAERGGVAREAVVEAMLNSVVASPVLSYRAPLILEGGMPNEPPADVDLQQKDLQLALALGRALGVPLPHAAASNELLNACRGLGIGHRDFVVVYDVYRRLAGIDRPVG
jgi:3-hydroxyisobutyrate dehydrogenase-like beta-hydroxyacid dehydrogenase